jgi:AcrR family transcriptional regulator
MDPRKKRTKALLNDAVITLLKERHIATLTVKDIIDQAEVARSTFYLHFLDKDDLVDKLITDVLQGFVARAAEARSSLLTPANRKEISLSRSLAFFDWICENSDFYRVMLGDNGSPMFKTKMLEVGVNYVMTEYHRALLDPPPGVPRPRELSFTVCALVNMKLGLTKIWLDEDMRLSVRYMAEMCSDFECAVLQTSGLYNFV